MEDSRYPTPRFDLHGSNALTALAYFRNRAVQLLHDEHDFSWSGLVTPLVHQEKGREVEWGAETILHDAAGHEYVSIYIYASARGQGHLRRHAAARPPGQRYVSSPGCGIFDALAHVSRDPLLAAPLTATPEYRAIERHYGDRRAKRSGLFLMHHIDEGLVVLGRRLYARDPVLRAWCLHPLVQGDDELAQAVVGGTLDDYATEVVVLALEYRNIANRFLSPMEDHPGYADPAKITLSPLAEVNQMLIADKVQNCKDFRLHHATTHPRADWLERYFQAWLAALGVDPSEIDRLTERAAIPAGTIGSPREI
jgi:hypothetical protein